jgi:hypothetical protein
MIPPPWAAATVTTSEVQCPGNYVGQVRPPETVIREARQEHSFWLKNSGYYGNCSRASRIATCSLAAALLESSAVDSSAF